MAERFDTWPHDATGIIEEALRDFVGDGEGEDERVLVAHDRAVRAATLRDAADQDAPAACEARRWLRARADRIEAEGGGL